MGKKQDQLVAFLQNRGGISNYSELRMAGFDKFTIKACISAHLVERIDRGIYSLLSGISVANPDLVTVALKIPKGVICLLSALSFHGATNEVSPYVDVAIARGSHESVISYPPVRFYHFDPVMWAIGVENHNIEGHQIKVYSLTKTVVDCFKFRNRFGVDVAREALKIAFNEKNADPKEIMQYAKICRVDKIIKPMLETLL
ncbi:MAG: transcriptional regulator [Gammaproteobacteria bacterium]